MQDAASRHCLPVFFMEAEKMKRRITDELLENYRIYLYEQEKGKATIEKYMRDLDKLLQYAAGRKVDKPLVIGYKEYLKNERNYKTSSINSFLVAANRFFDFMNWNELKVKTYRVQKETFMPENRELSRGEYRADWHDRPDYLRHGHTGGRTVVYHCSGCKMRNGRHL